MKFKMVRHQTGILCYTQRIWCFLLSTFIQIACKFLWSWLIHCNYMNVSNAKTLSVSCFRLDPDRPPWQPCQNRVQTPPHFSLLTIPYPLCFHLAQWRDLARRQMAWKNHIYKISHTCTLYTTIWQFLKITMYKLYRWLRWYPRSWLPPPP